jgi:hypothetical protein
MSRRRRRLSLPVLAAVIAVAAAFALGLLTARVTGERSHPTGRTFYVTPDGSDESDEMQVINLGTGVGTSVLQLRDAFAEASGRDIPYTMCPRRPGDVPELVADASLAQTS